MEDAFNHIQYWMDKMWLKLNPDKTAYILFGSKQQLNKASQEPIKVEPDLTELSNNVKYLGGVLDNTLNIYLWKYKWQGPPSSK